MQPVIVASGPTAAADTGRSGADHRRPGRPRSEQAEQAIIEATLDLFAEQGFEGVCVEAVAARAGVGKATIYRRWPNKEELLLAAFGSLKSPYPEPGGVCARDDLVAMLSVMCADRADPRKARRYALLLAAFGSLKSPYPEPGGVSARDDLVAMLSVMCADRADPRKARRYALLLGEGQKYPRLMARYKETVVEPRHEAIRAVIRRGIESGELRADTDVEIAMLALTGTIMAKEKSADGSLDGDFAARLVDELMLGLKPRNP